MALDRKILSEIERYRQINKYIFEQAAPEGELPPPPGGEAVPPAGAPPAEGEAGAAAPPEQPAQPIDVEADPDVEKIDDKGKSQEKGTEETEEVEVTDLVDTQKNIEQKQEEYFNNLFSQLSNLENRLKEMDSIMSKLNTLENKIERYREKTPQEKLELRTYDSYPFNQKLADFFEDKKDEMEKTGKNDYVLTTDDVKDLNVNDIKNSFQPGRSDSYENEFKR